MTRSKRDTKKLLAVAAAVLGFAATMPVTAASANPELGYNLIQAAGYGDPNGNFYTAKSSGNASWFRGGPGMPFDAANQNDYVARAASQGFNILYVIPGPGRYDPEHNVPANTTAQQYQGYCEDYAANHPNVDAFEIMNEPNAYMPPVEYSEYAYYCKLGIQFVRPNVPILGASTKRGALSPPPEEYTSQEWLDKFGFYTRASAPEIIISSHIYPSGVELQSAPQAANAVESYIAYDRIFAGTNWGVNRGLWITETGVKDHALANRLGLSSDGQACTPARKPEYLKQMFLKAGNNNAYDVGKVFIYRFTRNGPAGDDTGWNSAGVYDATGPPTPGEYFLNGYQDCGMSALASIAP